MSVSDYIKRINKSIKEGKLIIKKGDKVSANPEEEMVDRDLISFMVRLYKSRERSL